MKSHVTLVTKFCPICGEEKPTNELLFDPRLKNGKLRETFERHTCTGVELCEEHKAMVDSGEFVVFFVVKSEDKPERTGHGFLIRKDVANEMFNTDIAPVNHCAMELFNHITKMAEKVGQDEGIPS